MEVPTGEDSTVSRFLTRQFEQNTGSARKSGKKYHVVETQKITAAEAQTSQSRSASTQEHSKTRNNQN